MSLKKHLSKLMYLRTKQHKMIVFPNAKINLGLNILNKRDDGYHNLQSIFYPVKWCDILEIVKSDKFSFHLSGKRIEGASDENSVLKAYHLLKSDFNLSPVSIFLHKIIPTGAGLGGGSADASFTLLCLNKLFNLNLTIAQLKSYAAALGSDCPFFIFNEPSYVTGRGEKIEKINLDLSDYWIKIVHPGIHISTKQAFEGITTTNQTIDLISATKENNNINYNCFINDFQELIIDKNPTLATLKTNLESEGASYVSMSGSGSAFYGLFQFEPKVTGIGESEFVTRLRRIM